MEGVWDWAGLTAGGRPVLGEHEAELCWAEAAGGPGGGRGELGADDRRAAGHRTPPRGGMGEKIPHGARKRRVKKKGARADLCLRLQVEGAEGAASSSTTTPTSLC